jgi:nucleoside-diphosphate-sugar epimerase
MKRVLVTGATGFVGSNLARRLVSRGDDVHLLLRPEHASWRLEGLRERVRLHEADISDADQVGAVVDVVKPQWIFHLAAHGAYSFQNDVQRMVRTNVLGTVNLLEAGRRAGFEAFVHAGSSSEYGLQDHAPSEDERPEPNSPYAVTKLAATGFCRLFGRSASLPVATLRLYSVYGPFEDPRRLIPRLIVKGLAGEWPPLVDPSVARDFTFVDDVCDAFILAADKSGGEPGAIYNLGTGRQTTLREVVDVARDVLGITSHPAWSSLPRRSWDTDCWVADCGQIRAVLGWQARVDFSDGFRRTVDWLKGTAWAGEVYRS